MTGVFSLQGYEANCLISNIRKIWQIFSLVDNKLDSETIYDCQNGVIVPHILI